MHKNKNIQNQRPKMHYSARLPLWLAITTAMAIPMAHAETQSGDDFWSRLNLKGFGTAAIARSNESDAQFVRDLSQPNGMKKGWSSKVDSLFGLQANLVLDANTEAVIQGITRYRYDGSWRPELSWAFLRRDLSPDFTVRLGRMGMEFFMQADSRLIGYANLTVRPSADYYGPLVMSYFDGVDASLTTDTGQGLIRGKLFVGHASETTPFAEPETWKLHDSLMLGGHLDYIHGPWQIRYGHAQIRFKHQQPINELAGFDILSLAPELDVVDRWADYDSLGFVFDEGSLQVHGQISRISYKTSAYEDSHAGYLMTGYRLGQITPYAGYSRVWSKPVELTTPMPPPLAAYIRQFTAQTHSDQHTITLGGRWDFMRNMALKGQLDMVRGRPESRFPVRNATPSWDGRMNVFSMSLDFVF